MKTLTLAAALCLIPCAAFAGKEGAGPVGVGSATSGAVAISSAAASALAGSPTEAGGDTFLPSQAAQILLNAVQVESIAAVLRASAGAVVEGSIIKAPTTLTSGPGTIILDTSTGQLVVAEGTL